MTDAKGGIAPGFQSQIEAEEQYAKACLSVLKRLIDAGLVRKAQAEALALGMSLSRLAQMRESGDG